MPSDPPSINHLKAMITQHNSAVWPVPYACAQPYHPGSGSHGHGRAPGRELNKVQRTSAFYRRGLSAKHSSKRQLHLVNMVAVAASKYAHSYAFRLIRKNIQKALRPSFHFIHSCVTLPY